MPSILSLLLHPERRRPAPPAQRVDLRRVLLAGIAVWAVALLVSVALWSVSRTTGATVVTCGAGILLGGVGLWWERSHRASYRGED